MTPQLNKHVLSKSWFCGLFHFPFSFLTIGFPPHRTPDIRLLFQQSCENTCFTWPVWRSVSSGRPQGIQVLQVCKQSPLSPGEQSSHSKFSDFHLIQTDLLTLAHLLAWTAMWNFSCLCWNHIGTIKKIMYWKQTYITLKSMPIGSKYLQWFESMVKIV